MDPEMMHGRKFWIFEIFIYLRLYVRTFGNFSCHFLQTNTGTLIVHVDTCIYC